MFKYIVYAYISQHIYIYMYSVTFDIYLYPVHRGTPGILVQDNKYIFLYISFTFLLVSLVSLSLLEKIQFAAIFSRARVCCGKIRHPHLTAYWYLLSLSLDLFDFSFNSPSFLPVPFRAHGLSLLYFLSLPFDLSPLPRCFLSCLFSASYHSIKLTRSV